MKKRGKKDLSKFNSNLELRKRGITGLNVVIGVLVLVVIVIVGFVVYAISFGDVFQVKDLDYDEVLQIVDQKVLYNKDSGVLTLTLKKNPYNESVSGVVIKVDGKLNRGDKTYEYRQDVSFVDNEERFYSINLNGELDEVYKVSVYKIIETIKEENETNEVQKIISQKPSDVYVVPAKQGGSGGGGGGGGSGSSRTTTPTPNPTPTCEDGIINQDETGVDCGGVCNNECEIDQGTENETNYTLIDNYDYSVSQDIVYRSLISQYGITWTFDKEYKTGQFANGDYWVLAEPTVTILSMDPESNGINHGWEPNPTDINGQPYDNKITTFRPSLQPALPYTTSNITSIVKTISLVPDCVSSTCLQTAAVLTVVKEIPPGNGSEVFRPPYFGDEKPFYRVDSLRMDLLPTYKPISSMIPIENVVNQFKYVQLDHKYEWGGRAMHPTNNLPDYGSDISLRNNNAALRLMMNDSIENKRNATVVYVQAGIDYYHMLANGMRWNPNGGHAEGRRLPIAFAAVLLDNQSMKDSMINWESNQFGETGFTIKGRDGRVLYGQPFTGNTLTYWTAVAIDHGSRTSPDPHKYIDGGLAPASSYQVCCISMPEKGVATNVRLFEELYDIWGVYDQLEYADRWVNYGSIAAPDPCAPVVGVCLGGETPGALCNMTKTSVCGSGKCAPGVCKSGIALAGQPCLRDEDCNAVNSCNNLNMKLYGVYYGPDPNNPLECIPDRDPTDGIGRFPNRDGLSANSGAYGSSFVNGMWNTYRYASCNDGIKNFDEDGVDCGNSCVRDEDGDGHYIGYCFGDGTNECNDKNSGINPDAIEICTPENEIDENCDGQLHASYYTDEDNDNINTCLDNCPIDCNTNQEDSDGDGIGDACDGAPKLIESFSNMQSDFIKTNPNGISFELINGSVSFVTSSSYSTTWSYSNNRHIKMNSDDENIPDILVTTEGRSTWNKYIVNFTMGGKETRAGIVFNFQDKENYYFYNMRDASISIINGGVSTPLQSGFDVNFSKNSAPKNYTFEVDNTNGLQLKMYQQNYDGSIKSGFFSHPSSTLNYGSFGFRLNGGAGIGNFAFFDNLQITFENSYSGPTGVCA